MKASHTLFLTMAVCFCGVTGGVTFLVIMHLLHREIAIDGLICAAGYPALLIGLYGGILWLYRKDDSKKH